MNASDKERKYLDRLLKTVRENPNDERSLDNLLATACFMLESRSSRSLRSKYPDLRRILETGVVTSELFLTLKRRVQSKQIAIPQTSGELLGLVHTIQPYLLKDLAKKETGRGGTTDSTANDLTASQQPNPRKTVSLARADPANARLQQPSHTADQRAKILYEEWRATLDDRERRIVDIMLDTQNNELTKAAEMSRIAAELDISVGQVYRLLAELLDSFKTFMGLPED